MDLDEAKARLQSMFERKMQMANAERFGRAARTVGEIHRDDATAIAMVLAALPEGAT